ncbi:TPA: restriction endonuclease subunit S [Acinetobacter baumannii]|uniref:restriction endonuclease subunit S n=1 Tax=Acinetobacter TaxID=469 RepID=UPI00125065F5|nr:MULTISPECIES: restriction endonuclease subunit S [Acinetobacter]MEC6128230.1 restriction endonuclease subunit S [Acinetobacter ursingii]HEO1827200.1 restriction endonuclease subunit S [Acinetobacter baumannii]
MQFKQYPSYKNSGVEWLGDVPEHWEVKKIKRISSVKRGASPRPINDLKYFDDNGEYAWVRISDVTRSNGFLFETEQRLSSLGASFSVKLEPESLFLSIAATVGKPCITKIKTCIHDGFVYFPKLNKHRDLLFNIFESKLCFVGLGKLGTQLNLNSETVEDIYVAIPPESEEKAILGYIQTETTRIDNLIAKQEKLIELLEEQRKSIISHAVTKGLNPNAPMKDSGVEWLGEVPEHWTVLKNRHIFNFSKGLSITKENLQENGVPCVSYGEVHSKFGFEFNPEINDMKFVSEEYLETSKNCLLNSGDFIFADTSEDFEGSGNFSYLNSNSQVFAGYHTVIARLKSKQKPRFFAYIFDSNAHRKQIQTQVKGIKVFSITQGILKDIYSWLPPVHEQDLIVRYLDNECKKISLLKAKQIELIEKLKEYRSSIISHAVTGKIDIREFC